MSGENVKVYVRFRPINEREKSERTSFNLDIKYAQDGRTVDLKTNSALYSEQSFSFDYIFDPATTQVFFYDTACKKVVDDVLAGYNGTIFAYGQTGAGKSWSMMGNIAKPEMYGLIPRAAASVFSLIEKAEAGIEFRIACSYVEIYNESVQDLFDTSKKNLKIHESPEKGIYIDGLTQEYVSNEQEIYQLLELGAQNRVVSFTQMNAQSSRSHSLFILQVQQTNTETGSVKSGKLNLVDLAGSEKVGKTGATGTTLEEAKKINLSLSVLGKCINALVEQKPHIPFRDSKLTRILSESLGGNCKTSLICACSPHPFNFEETLSTLRFGQRAKSIQNTVKVNSTKSAKELEKIVQNLTAQIQDLQKRIKDLSDENSSLKRNGATVTGVEPETAPTQSNSLETSDPLKTAELQLQLEALQCKLNDETQRMKEEIEDLQTINQELEENMKNAEEKATNLETELEIMIEEHETLELTKQDLQKKWSFEKEELQVEMEQLLNHVDEIEEEKTKLEQELKRIREEESPAQLKDSEERGKLVAEVNRLESQLQQTQRTVETMKAHQAELEDNLEKEKTSSIELQASVSRIVKENTVAQQRTQDELQSLRDKLDILRKEKDALETEHIKSESEVRRLSSEVSLASAREKDLIKEVEALRAENSEKDGEILKLKMSTQTIPAAMENMMVTEYKKALQELKEQKDTVTKEKDKEIRKLLQYVEELKSDVKLATQTFEMQIQKKSEAHLEEQVKATKLQERLKEVAKENSKITEETSIIRANLEREKKKILADAAKEREASAQKDNKIAELQKEVEKLLVQQEKLRQGHNIGATEEADLKNMTPGKGSMNFKNLVNEVMELRTKYKKTEAQRKKFEDEANHHRKENSNYRNKLQAAEQKVELQKTRISQLEEELERVRTSQNLRKNEADMFHKQRTEMQAKIDELQQALEAMEKAQSIRRSTKVVKPVVSKAKALTPQGSLFGQHLLRKTGSPLPTNT